MDQRSAHHARLDDGRLGLEVAAVSLCGPVRAENQDAWELMPLSAAPGCALILADGMGGHVDGAVASYLTVRAVGARLQASSDPHAGLLAAIDDANAAIARHRGERGVVTGTTLVAAVTSGGRTTVVNVGDSRAYLRRAGSLRQVTIDHSWVAEEVRAGRLRPEQAIGHPRRSVITRALVGEPVVADAFDLDPAPGDTLLLCSDGLWEPLGDAGMAEVLDAGGALEALLERACAEAVRRGGQDNVTAVACRVLAAE